MPDALITSGSNPRLRAAAALRERPERDERGLTLVDGVRELERAMEAGIPLVEAFVSEALERRAGGSELLDELARRNVPLVRVAAAAFSRLAFGGRDEGIVAVVRSPATTLAGLKMPADPLLVVLERVEKPGNVGAVLRTADAAGADALIAADPATDLHNPNVVRASVGTVFTVPVAAAPSGEVAAWLAEHGIRAIAASPDATTPYWDADLTGSLAVVLGAEAEGLSAAWPRAGIDAVRIPMHGTTDSLNVSVAAALVLYEARRQRDRR